MTDLLTDIQTPRLLLRPLKTNARGTRELAWFHKIWTNIEATKWSPRGPCKDEEDSMAWMHGIICSVDCDTKPKLSYAVLYPSQGRDTSGENTKACWEIAGLVTLLPTNFSVSPDGATSVDDPPEAGYKYMEVGYLFHPEVWGRGYATESCRAMIEAYAGLLPKVQGLPTELCANVHKANGASLRVAEKLEFQKMGVFKSKPLPLAEGRDLDVVHFTRKL